MDDTPQPNITIKGWNGPVYPTDIEEANNFLMGYTGKDYELVGIAAAIGGTIGYGATSEASVKGAFSYQLTFYAHPDSRIMMAFPPRSNGTIPRSIAFYYGRGVALSQISALLEEFLKVIKRR
ncbi:MAG TPA: hypothetical protein VLI92_01710 [Candidatus Saccharimonadales bacterium]|nr:hypothetical protein [Candidatus Saccharimonadales bacterium]